MTMGAREYLAIMAEKTVRSRILFKVSLSHYKRISNSAKHGAYSTGYIINILCHSAELFEVFFFSCDVLLAELVAQWVEHSA